MNNRKHKIIIALCLLLTMFALTACSSKTAENKEEPAAEETAAEEMEPEETETEADEAEEESAENVADEDSELVEAEFFDLKFSYQSKYQYDADDNSAAIVMQPAEEFIMIISTDISKLSDTEKEMYFENALDVFLDNFEVQLLETADVELNGINSKAAVCTTKYENTWLSTSANLIQNDSRSYIIVYYYDAFAEGDSNLEDYQAFIESFELGE